MNEQPSQRIPLSEAIRRFGRSQPQNYRIMVLGALDQAWTDRLAGLRIATQCESTSDPTVTVLQGLVQDQAQLTGILNTLNDQRLPLLSVELLKNAELND